MVFLKRKNISRKFITLANLATIFSCTAESYSNRMKEENSKFDIKKLENLIDEGYKQMSQSVEKSIIVIGHTGTGKSTLINGLMGKELEAKKNEEKDYVISLKVGQEGAMIGHTGSETSVPSIWKDDFQNIYWDCPGFEDTKGPVQEIANSFFLKKIFDNSQSVKLVLVISENQMKSDRKLGLLNINKKLARIFENFNDVKYAISVIVTKANKIEEIDDIRNIIKNFAKWPDNQNITENEKCFYEHFATDGSVAIFQEPKTAGNFFIEKNLSKAIQQTTYIKSPKIKLPISQSSIMYVREILFGKSKSDIENKNSILLENFMLFIGNDQRHSSNFDKLYELCDFGVLVSKILDIENQIDAGDFRQYFRFVGDFCDKCQLAYDLKQELEVISFCKVILENDKDRFSFFTNSVFSHIRPLISEKAKNIIDKIEVKYSELKDRFIADSKNYFNANTNNKAALMNFIQNLEKFNIAENVEVVLDLSSLDKILDEKIIKELIIMHNHILEINEKIKIFGRYIPNQSQTIKNHLNERLNNVKKEIEKIEEEEKKQAKAEFDALQQQYNATNTIKTNLEQQLAQKSNLVYTQQQYQEAINNTNASWSGYVHHSQIDAVKKKYDGWVSKSDFYKKQSEIHETHRCFIQGRINELSHLFSWWKPDSNNLAALYTHTAERDRYANLAKEQ